MTLLPGKLIVTCPKTDSEVDAKVACVDCKSYQHITWRGLKPFIACNYEK